jgi:hypothetical protein
VAVAGRGGSEVVSDVCRCDDVVCDVVIGSILAFSGLISKPFHRPALALLNMHNHVFVCLVDNRSSLCSVSPRLSKHSHVHDFSAISFPPPMHNATEK